MSLSQGNAKPVVSCHNDWDPLEEIIVGVLDGAAMPAMTLAGMAIMERQAIDLVPEGALRNMLSVEGKPRSVVSSNYEAAKRELEEFVRVLEGEGVTVKRPDPIDNSRWYSTPDWTCSSGQSQTCPRDVIMVVGDEIVEAPMSWRSRYFEFRAYRRLIREYFERGAKWTAAPKPLMTDALYNYDYVHGKEYCLTEAEPVFDAADVARCGKDLFVQLSHVTNRSGIEWLRRHFAPTYNVHTLETQDDRAIHIDATFVMLAPGKLMINPERVKHVPEIFKKAGWDILEATKSLIEDDPVYRWLDMNVLSLDEKRVIVEKSEERFIRQLRDWGFTPIPVAFRNFYSFGGSFHCATCDVRRVGTLKSYF